MVGARDVTIASTRHLFVVLDRFPRPAARLIIRAASGRGPRPSPRDSNARGRAASASIELDLVERHGGRARVMAAARFADGKPFLDLRPGQATSARGSSVVVRVGPPRRAIRAVVAAKIVDADAADAPRGNTGRLRERDGGERRHGARPRRRRAGDLELRVPCEEAPARTDDVLDAPKTSRVGVGLARTRRNCRKTRWSNSQPRRMMRRAPRTPKMA